MATDYKALGKRISNARKQAGITQEALGEQLNMTRKHISVIESAIKRPSLDALVDIANALDVSTDDLLVDSLMHSTSTSNSEIHRLLLDCNEIEQEILTRMVREMKAILYGLGICGQNHSYGMKCPPDREDLRILSTRRAFFLLTLLFLCSYAPYFSNALRITSSQLNSTFIV